MNTAAPFTARIEKMTFAELQADAALCRKVLKDGEINGYPLSADDEDEFKAWLSDFEDEIETRKEWATAVNTVASSTASTAEKAAAGEVIDRHIAALPPNEWPEQSQTTNRRAA